MGNQKKGRTIILTSEEKKNFKTKFLMRQKHYIMIENKFMRKI